MRTIIKLTIIEMANITEWVSDKLHDILGLSDKFTAEFIVAIAKKSSSEDAFLRKLEETGAITMNSTVLTFATELWHKVPHKSVSNDRYRANREKEKQAILLQQKNKSYSLVSDDDDDDTETAAKKSSKKSKKESGKERQQRKGEDKGSSRKRRNLRKEKASAWESESEEEETSHNVKRTKADSDSDEWERYE